MGLRRQIERVLSQGRPTNARTTINDTREMAKKTRALSASSLAERLGAADTRRSVVLASRALYAKDGRYEGMVSTLARDATKGGYQVQVEDERAKEIADALKKRLRLHERLDDWARLTFVDGDTLLEVGVNSDLEISEAVRKPTLSMRRNSSKGSDLFPNPMYAYWQDERPYITAPTKDAVWYADWQIVHARWKHDEGSRYGRPLMASGDMAYKRLTEGERDMAIRRKVRAGMRYLHVVETDDPAELERYEVENELALDNPFMAVADFFSTRPGSITAVQGDSNLGMIEDVMHHLETWFSGSPVPKALLGYGRDLNRDVLEEQKRQYDETLDSVKSWVAKQLVQPFLELQWLLAGMVPETLDYEISWPTKDIVTPDSILKIAQAVQMLRMLFVPEPVILMILAQFLPGVTIEMLQQTADAATNDAERLGQIAQQLVRGGGRGDDENDS